MKSLTNATNGFMIISDSFMTAIFKQSLLRTFAKDEQGYLKMGFNGTFEVLVSLLGLIMNISLYVDNQGTQGLWSYRTRHFRQQEIILCRRDRNWNRSNFRLEDLFPYPQNLFGNLLRSGHPRRATSSAQPVWFDSIRDPLPARIRSIPTSSNHPSPYIPRRRSPRHRPVFRPGSSGRSHG